MNLEIGRNYEVTVIKILPVGAVVELEDSSTELVHISNIADCYIADVADFVSVGEKYVATCEEGTKKPIQLSFRPLDLKSHRKPVDRKRVYTQSKDIDELITSVNSTYADKQRSQDKRNKRR